MFSYCFLVRPSECMPLLINEKFLSCNTLLGVSAVTQWSTFDGLITINCKLRAKFSIRLIKMHDCYSSVAMTPMWKQENLVDEKNFVIYISIRTKKCGVVVVAMGNFIWAKGKRRWSNLI